MKTELTAGEQQKTAPALWRYGAAVLSVAVAYILAKAADNYLHSQPFALLFLCAILFSAWVGGFGPGLLAVALSLLVFAYYFVNPAPTLAINVTEVPRLGVFAAIGVTVAVLTASQRSVIASLRRARDDLAGAVQELRRTNESLRAEIAERKRAEDQVREGQQLLNLVLATLPVGVAVTNREGDIVLANAASDRIWGGMIAIGRDRWAQSKGFWHESGKRIAPSDWPSVRALSEGQTSLNDLIDIEAFDGQPKTIQNASAPVRNAQGLIVGTVIVNEDVTERVRAEEALRESEAKLKEAQRLANIGYWERDLVTDRLTWSEESYRIFGQPKDVTLTSAKLQEFIHPDDRSLQSEALREVLEKGRKYDVEYRIVRPDGQIRFVHVWDEIERDASGRVVRIFGTVQDITERKQAELLLHTQAQEIRAIVENSPDLIVRFDRQLRRTFVNTAFIKATALPKEKLLGREITSAAKDGAEAATEEIAILEGSLRRAFDTRQPLDFESTLPLATGRRTFTVHLEPEFDARGALTSILVISRDITERIEAENKLRVSRERLRALTARLESLREEEATRIAREIHDDLGQKLTGLKMDLVRAERKIEELGTSPVVNSLVDSIVSATELTDGITASVQEIAADLRPSVLDKLGLAAALQYEARIFERRAGIHCEVLLREPEVIRSREHATALFRIFQEALTNVARHAQARMVKVELRVEACAVILTVQDDGRGIAEADIAKPESLGLLGMKERAELLGGEISFRRNSNQKGTVVTVRIPQMGETVSCGC